MIADTASRVRRFAPTNLGDGDWFEPVENYTSQIRFDAERRLMRRLPVPFCPVAALPKAGSYMARASAGV